MPSIVVPPPPPLTRERAVQMIERVRREMPGLQADAYRREAARRLGVDYDTMLAALRRPLDSAGVTPDAKPKPPPGTNMPKVQAS